MNQSKPWEPEALKRIRFWIVWSKVATLVAASLALFLAIEVDKCDRVMTAKMEVERELAIERNRPGLTPWEPVEITFYHDSFHGRTAADGSTFSQNLPTCASTFLEKGTIVTVRTKGNKLVTFFVTDKLPEERMDRLDVSRHIARRLGIETTGRLVMDTAIVKI